MKNQVITSIISGFGVVDCFFSVGLAGEMTRETLPFPETGQKFRIESFLKTFSNAKTGQGLFAWLWPGFVSALVTEYIPSHEKAVSLWALE